MATIRSERYSADRGRVLRLVLREAALPAGAGIVVAVLGSIGVGRLIGSQLFGVTGHDPMVIGGATAPAGGGGSIARYIPAWRATKANPLVALRWE